MKSWKLVTSTNYEKQFAKLDREIQKRILAFFAKKVLIISDPCVYAKQLTGNLAGYWSFRVGDYRIIADIDGQNVIIIALVVEHRSKVYGGH